MSDDQTPGCFDSFRAIIPAATVAGAAIVSLYYYYQTRQQYVTLPQSPLAAEAVETLKVTATIKCISHSCLHA